VADELVVATVRAAEQQPGARAPALLLTLDLGTYGAAQAVMAAGMYDADELVGTQLVCRREDDGAVVVAARSHASGDVPLRPDREVEPGTLVS
jgi:tRNA-binding EMAP/Myf-like protein